MMWLLIIWLKCIVYQNHRHIFPLLLRSTANFWAWLIYHWEPGSVGQIYCVLPFKLWEQEYAIKNKWRAYKCSHSPCQNAGNSASKLFLRVSDQHSKILWHERSRAMIFQLRFLWHNTNAYLFQRKLGSSTMLPWLLGSSSKFPRFTCLWFPFCEMEPVSNTAVTWVSNLYFTEGHFDLFYSCLQNSPYQRWKRHSLREKQKCWNTCNAMHWQKCHSLVFIGQMFLHEELYKKHYHH